MNWDDMRLFLAVARAEGLTGASRMVKLDPATLGRRIARLEQSLGTALFVKSPKGYVLTGGGVQMLERAITAEQALTFPDDHGAEADQLRGQIRIGAPDGAANFLLPQVCARIQAHNPSLEVQILSLPRVVNLSRREADLAITVSPPAAGQLTVQKIADYHLHLAMRRDGPNVTCLDDIKNMPVVGYIPDMIFDKELDYLGVFSDGAVQRASNSVAVQMQMVRQAGVGIMHDFALATLPELTRILVDQISLTRSFYLVRHDADRHSTRLATFARALIDGMQQEITSLENTVSLTDMAMVCDT